jgi:hypothetical protein
MRSKKGGKKMKKWKFFAVAFCMLIIVSFTSQLQAGSVTQTQEIEANALFAPSGNPNPDQPLPGLVGAFRTWFTIHDAGGVCQPPLDGAALCTWASYSFCNSGVVPCAEGYGFVPNSAFTGTLGFNYLRPDTVKLVVDTSKVVGFDNYLCTELDPNNICLSSTSAPGGMIEVTYTKQPVLAVLGNNAQTVIENRISSTVTEINGLFSSLAAGYVLSTDFSQTDNIQECVSDVGSCYGEMYREVLVTTTKNAPTGTRAMRTPSQLAERLGMPARAVMKLRAMEQAQRRAAPGALVR